MTTPRLAVVPDLDGAAALLEELASVLWREREQLTELVFRAVVERSLLVSDDVEWLVAADRDLRSASQRLREIEVLRAATAERVNVRFGLPPEATLGSLAAVVSEPWPGLLLDHREQLQALNDRLAEAGNRVVTLATERLDRFERLDRLDWDGGQA